MKNKVTLTITSKGYKVEAILDGQRYVRNMRKKRRGIYIGTKGPNPDIEEMDEIDEAFSDEIGSLLISASDISELLADFEEMEE